MRAHFERLAPLLPILHMSSPLQRRRNVRDDRRTAAAQQYRAPTPTSGRSSTRAPRSSACACTASTTASRCSLRPFGKYLDPDKGSSCCVSSWRRIDDNSIPARAKVVGGYINSALAKTEAVENGFDEAIMLTHEGHVSEGSGENIFLVSDGKLDHAFGAPTTSSLGITRNTVMELARTSSASQRWSAASTAASCTPPTSAS